jgi:hypothetical protein
MGNRIVDSYSVRLPTSLQQSFEPIRRIGGKTGWYYANFLWRLRGAIDKLAGGPGLRKSSKSSDEPVVGEALDLWRVEDYEPNHLLRLIAEMKLPGRAWLQFEASGDGSSALIRQTAIFEPRGLPGLIYWHALYPAHRLIFKGMLRRIARSA